MRIVVAYISIFILSIAFLVVTDMLTGMDLTTAIEILKEAFSVTSMGENLIIVSLLLVPFFFPFITYLNRHRKKAKSMRNPN